MTAKTPSTPASRVDRTPASTAGGPRGKEEKIVVTVRLRPLSKREQSARDQVAWECIDDHTIVYKQPAQDRSIQPASFTFGIKLIFIFHHKFTLTLFPCLHLERFFHGMASQPCGEAINHVHVLMRLLKSRGCSVRNKST